MSDARLSWWLFVVAALARTVACLGLAVFGPDSPYFLTMGDGMREGRFLDALQLLYHPMYPLLIAIAGPLFGGSVAAAHAISVLLGAATAVPLYFVVRELFGRPAAFVTTLLYALYPRIVEIQADVMTESTFMFFFTASMGLTWKMGEEPTPERGVTLGLAAAAAFLTRPEGLLAIGMAVAWPAATALARRKASAASIGGLVLTPLLILLAIFPYLLWVKSVRGHWALSARASLVSAELATGLSGGPQRQVGVGGARLYIEYFQAFLHLNLYGALFPFHALGLMSLRGVGAKRLLFFGAFLFGLLGGVLVTLRQHDFMSDRYLMMAMVLASAIAAVGMVRAAAWAAQRWPVVRARPELCAAVLLAIVVLPGARWFGLRRMESRTYEQAGRWIAARGKKIRTIPGIAQVAYFAGARPALSPTSREAALEQIRTLGAGCFVYDERARHQGADNFLKDCEFLESPVRIDGPPGTVPVFVQFVK